MWSLAFFFSILAFAAEPFESSAWKALLHFEGKATSIAENSPFFLSRERTAEAEWLATMEEFRRNPETICRFPARAIFLRKILAEEFLEPKGNLYCERWQRWKTAISAKGIELVFAAGFISSPSSMYGHTLLKFPRSGKTEGQELLDYTLSFGAETAGAGGFAYVWKGLSGGFDGFYTTAPFYLKVREYNYVDNRDFWIYPVKTNPEQLELLAAHAWELRDIHFPYFFLRKNCSYFLLEYLKVAFPDLPLLDGFSYWAIPMDTIRVLKKYSLVEEPRYKPSRHKILEERKKELSTDEREEVKKILAEENWSPSSAKVLDAAYDLFRYRQEGKVPDTKKENSLLQARSKYPASPDLIFHEIPPEYGHGTSRLGLLAGQNSRHQFGELQYRGALHDLLSNDLGYEPYSELTMGDLVFRWEDRFFLERFDILKIRSVPPVDSWGFRKSWTFRTGLHRFQALPCEGWNCLGGYMATGIGASAQLGPVLGFVLAEGEIEAGKAFEKNHRMGVGPSAGFWIPFGAKTKFLAETEKRWRLTGNKFIPLYRLGLSQEFSVMQIRVSWEQIASYEEAKLGMYWYF